MPDIIADFHGTLYLDPDEGPLWKYVAARAVDDSIPYHPIRLLNLAIAKPILEGLVEQYERGEIGYDKIYEAYNSRVLSHLQIGFVKSAICEYARLPETREKLDGRMLRPIKSASGRKGILSTGCVQFINAMQDAPDFFKGDYVIANTVGMSGWRGSGSDFILSVYGNKPQLLRDIFFGPFKPPRYFGFDPKNTVYMGDNADEEPAFRYVLDRGGKVVVPFYATDDFKQHAASEYDAIVPENEQDLSRFLKSLK